MREFHVDEAQTKGTITITDLPKQKINGHEINAWLDQDWGNELAFSPCELADALGVDEADFDQIFPGLFRINGDLPPLYFSELPGFILGLARWRKYQGLSELPRRVTGCEYCGQPGDICMDGKECCLAMLDKADDRTHMPGGTGSNRLN